MKVIAIAAVSENRAIGKNNDLIWHLPDDMKFFKTQTEGHAVIMGRKNYESIPHAFRPLPRRTNIVISRNEGYQAHGCILVTSLQDALAYCQKKNMDQAYIIGGGEIYKLALETDVVDEMLITEVEGHFDADAFYPDFDRSLWDTEILSVHPRDQKHAHAFRMMRYTKRT